MEAGRASPAERRAHARTPGGEEESGFALLADDALDTETAQVEKVREREPGVFVSEPEIGSERNLPTAGTLGTSNTSGVTENR